jgi:small-conductance mechanosensitive channel
VTNELIVQELIERKTYIRIFWDILNYQIFDIDGHAFSLAKLVLGVILLAFGYILSVKASRAIERRIFFRMQMDESLRYTLGRFSFYLLLIFSSLFTLHVLSVPLTIFAVVGGAVAIGVGFGSQNIISNFISGILIMIERPVRIGDFIELGTITGTVERIGIRSTILNTPSNARVVVPNTFFLEKSVLNWTLADVYQYGSVRVSVAYGSDPKKVEELCLQATHDAGLLSETNPSSVLLSEFGDHALIFDIGFWCNAANTGQRKKVESAVRHNVLALLTQNQIVMPFPQQEVHLKTSTPVGVNVQS